MKTQSVTISNPKQFKTRTIYFLRYDGKWIKDQEYSTDSKFDSEIKKRMNLIKKTKALNGNVELFWK